MNFDQSTRARMFDAIYKATHRDYKGVSSLDGSRHVMSHETFGGSRLVSLETISDAELWDR